MKKNLEIDQSKKREPVVQSWFSFFTFFVPTTVRLHQFFRSNLWHGYSNFITHYRFFILPSGLRKTTLRLVSVFLF
ncbi:hypothetical protein BUE63_14105 [Bacillus sp. MB353a]|nr:hypothetical protein BUE63_14105 [Bacillus sp. MB353a]